MWQISMEKYRTQQKIQWNSDFIDMCMLLLLLKADSIYTIILTGAWTLAHAAS